MKRLASRKGFSLVELLTVIAIIAILASIIFPVMGRVSENARRNKCITQLHQIGVGLQMFKQDNRRYPDILGTVVQIAPGGAVIPFDQAKNPPAGAPMGLFPEYVQSNARLYHCPDSKNLDTSASETYDPNQYDVANSSAAAHTPWPVYSYDSYDFYRIGPSALQQHYARVWCDCGSGADPAAAVKGMIADDTQNPPNTGDAASDYERQLKFRNPPGNTVVTWCSWHEAGMSGRVPTLFLDGNVDSLDAAAVETFKWRVLPHRE